MTDTPLPDMPDQPEPPVDPDAPQNPDQPGEPPPAPVPDAELEGADDEAERTVGRHRDDYGR